LRAGDEVMRRLGAGVNRRRRRCAEVAGAVGVWLGTAVRADGRRRGSVRRGRVRARGHTGRPGRGACTRGSERAGCGVARLRSWRRGVHGSARCGAASVCTHACAGCGACARAWAVASCCCWCRGVRASVARSRAGAGRRPRRGGRAGQGWRGVRGSGQERGPGAALGKGGRKGRKEREMERGEGRDSRRRDVTPAGHARRSLESRRDSRRGLRPVGHARVARRGGWDNGCSGRRNDLGIWV